MERTVKVHEGRVLELLFLIGRAIGWKLEGPNSMAQKGQLSVRSAPVRKIRAVEPAPELISFPPAFVNLANDLLDALRKEWEVEDAERMEPYLTKLQFLDDEIEKHLASAANQDREIEELQERLNEEYERGRGSGYDAGLSDGYNDAIRQMRVSREDLDNIEQDIYYYCTYLCDPKEIKRTTLEDPKCMDCPLKNSLRKLQLRCFNEEERPFPIYRKEWDAYTKHQKYDLPKETYEEYVARLKNSTD